MDFAVLNGLSYGVYIISAMDGERACGCIANTCSQITNEPLTLAISLNKENFTHKVVEKTGRFVVNILSEDTDPKIISVFGFKKSDSYDKYSEAKHEMHGGLPVIAENSCGAILCTVLSKHDMGTHTVFFAQIEETVNMGASNPMTYAYYHKVIKGKAPRTAPTYQPPQQEQGSGDYICTVCGYVHKGDIATEPESYICPICGVPKSKFKKM